MSASATFLRHITIKFHSIIVEICIYDEKICEESPHGRFRGFAFSPPNILCPCGGTAVVPRAHGVPDGLWGHCHGLLPGRRSQDLRAHPRGGSARRIQHKPLFQVCTFRVPFGRIARHPFFYWPGWTRALWPRPRTCCRGACSPRARCSAGCLPRPSRPSSRRSTSTTAARSAW